MNRYIIVVVTCTVEVNAQKIANFSVEVCIYFCTETFLKDVLNFVGLTEVEEVVHI